MPFTDRKRVNSTSTSNCGTGAPLRPPISKATTQRCGEIGGKQRCSNATIQSNNAETDDRGYIYVADRSNTGLHILELTGEARASAGLPPN